VLYLFSNWYRSMHNCSAFLYLRGFFKKNLQFFFTPAAYISSLRYS
jgi:hypothetical protein